MNKNEILKQNSEAWNTAAKNFFGSEALPFWFPFDKGEFKDLIGEIEGKTFLEIACGSGHSMKYLLDNGAKFVYGIDFSSEQINYAKDLNKVYIDEGKAKLLLQPMENELGLTGLDTVFSVYGFGWTQEPEKMLKNIFDSLKDGGRFIWSWDHPLCSISEIQDSKIVIIDPYNGTNLIQRNLFGNDVYQLVSGISQWFEMIQKTGFKIKQFIEAYPTGIPDDYNDHGGYYAREKIEKIPTSMIWVLEK
jgi:SAM-dependent methyltransferase